MHKKYSAITDANELSLLYQNLTFIKEMVKYIIKEINEGNSSWTIDCLLLSFCDMIRITKESKEIVTICIYLFILYFMQ